MEIYHKEHQSVGEFNGGAILENKPIGFPQEGGSLKPYSNLFYWAHAHTKEGSTIGLHPHQGFEIMSFVLKGTIEHYDTKNEKWFPLDAGDAQIIRAGNGISHAEKMNAGSHIFQIWVDPNLSKTLEKPASYDDYKSSAFKVTEENGIKTKHYAGENGLMELETAGLTIQEWTMPSGEFKFDVPSGEIWSVYVMSGETELNGNTLRTDDFFKETENKSFTLVNKDEIKLFVVKNPVSPGYATYASRYLRR